MGIISALKKAIALEYTPGRSAPRIVAKARGELVNKVLLLAERYNIPVYNDPDLADSLISLDTGTEIPPHLFRAVAEVIAYCYRINAGFRDKLENRT